MTLPIRLAFTMGDPAGIGPEIIAKATRQMAGLVHSGHAEFIVLGSAEAIQQAEKRMNLPATDNGRPFYTMVDVGPVAQPVVLGEISAAGGEWAYQAIAKAVSLVQAGKADAIVTGPLCKEALHMAGHHFEGHTEMLAHLTGQRDAVAGDHLEVAMRHRVSQAEFGDGHRAQCRGDQEAGLGVGQSEALVERGRVDGAEQIRHGTGHPGRDTADQQTGGLALNARHG